MKDILLYLCIAILIAHELDAMTQSEWRLLFILRQLPEQSAKAIFVLLHVPLVMLLLWLANHDSASVQMYARGAIALFLIIHSALHRRLEPHPAYTFHSLMSKGLIYGGGVAGCLYCISVLVL